MAAGPDGCPEIEEFAGAELAALTGQGTRAGEQMIRDAVTVRHRHPRPLGTATRRRGPSRGWRARWRSGALTAGLSQAQALWVDAETSPYATSLPPARFLDLLEAKIIEVDPLRPSSATSSGPTAVRPRRTQGRARAADAGGARTRRRRHLRRGGPRPARGGAGRAGRHRLRRRTSRQGAADPGEPCAGPRAAARRERRPSTPTSPTTCSRRRAGWMVDAGGQPLPGLPTATAQAPPAGAVEEGVDPELLARVLAALEQFDASRLDPLTVVHAALLGRHAERRFGTVRVEELGPWTMRQLQPWLSHPESPEQIQSRITVRPSSTPGPSSLSTGTRSPRGWPSSSRCGNLSRSSPTAWPRREERTRTTSSLPAGSPAADSTGQPRAAGQATSSIKTHGGWAAASGRRRGVLVAHATRSLAQGGRFRHAPPRPR